MPDLSKRTKLWMRPNEKEIASVYGDFNEVFSGDQENKTAWRDFSEKLQKDSPVQDQALWILKIY